MMTNNINEFVIYHNPRCSKSRAALELLRQGGIEPTIIEYLKTPPTKAALLDVIEKLGVKPEALLRKGEDLFKEQFADRILSDEECIAAMLEYPIFIERPIVVHGTRAVIGRPPQLIVELL